MRMVIALGGNALGTTLSQQRTAVASTAAVMADLIAQGHQVIITHGNGPQVGIIHNAMSVLQREDPEQEDTPLPVCGAMSQAYIGLDLQAALDRELRQRGLGRPVCTVLTQTVVDGADPAFSKPSKPIGKFLTRQEAEELSAATGYVFREDAGRGWRRYVPSPLPVDIVELDAIRLLLQGGAVVIACGGGGVPVVAEGNTLRPVGAVIDKDFASALLAEKLEADMLLILTAVEKVALHYRTPQQQWLDHLTPEEAEAYAGEFAAGSMLPKVQAAARFAASGAGRKALITALDRAADGLAGKTGTLVSR